MDFSTFDDLKQLLSHEQSAMRTQTKQNPSNRANVENAMAKRRILGTTIKMTQQRKTVMVRSKRARREAIEEMGRAQSTAISNKIVKTQVVINKDTEMLERQYADRIADQSIKMAVPDPEDEDGFAY